jgi:ribulose-bisphosphate carboxylase small chain
MSFIVNRPPYEPGFMLDRMETDGRTMRYSIRSYAAVAPEGERYNDSK